jgi:hypothetical protein
VSDFKWGSYRVLDDWINAERSYIQDRLPADFTSRRLQRIREDACRNAAPDTIKCAKWSQTDSFLYTHEFPIHIAHPTKRAFRITAEYVCGDCRLKRPVSNETFYQTLALPTNEKTRARYIQGEVQMPTEFFKRAIANALLVGWVPFHHAISYWIQIDELEASRAGLKEVFKRLLRRKNRTEEMMTDVVNKESEDEFEKQMQFINQDEIRRIDKLLKEGDLPPDLKQLLKDGMQARLQK